MKTKIAIGAALAGAALLGALAVAYGSAQQTTASKQRVAQGASSSQFSVEDEDAIRAIVRDYIQENPEVVVESLRSYSERERLAQEQRFKDAAKTNLAALLDPRHGFVAGANTAAAKVAVIEFYDYHCGFCKRATGTVLDLARKDPQVKVVFRELPMLREESDFAAEASLASRAQGKFLEFHAAMMAAQGVITRDRVREIAASVGVDFAKLEAEAKKPAVKEAIAETHRLASEMAVDGTPTFVVASLDGDFLEVIPGLREDLLKAAIADAKKASKKK